MPGRSAGPDTAFLRCKADDQASDGAYPRTRSLLAYPPDRRPYGSDDDQDPQRAGA